MSKNDKNTHKSTSGAPGFIFVCGVVILFVALNYGIRLTGRFQNSSNDILTAQQVLSETDTMTNMTVPYQRCMDSQGHELSIVKYTDESGKNLGTPNRELQVCRTTDGVIAANDTRFASIKLDQTNFAQLSDQNLVDLVLRSQQVLQGQCGNYGADSNNIEVVSYVAKQFADIRVSSCQRGGYYGSMLFAYKREGWVLADDTSQHGDIVRCDAMQKHSIPALFIITSETAECTTKDGRRQDIVSGIQY